MVAPSLERFGRYVVLESLGQGGTGRVDLALTVDARGYEQLVVLKRPRDERDENGMLVRLLVKEALITARLTHPNLVTVFGIEQHGTQIAIAMEHLDGHSLAELGEEHRANGDRTPVPVVMAILREALLGIDSAHALTDSAGRPLRLVHRDLTPHNIFVTRDGHTKVLDFGIAKFAEGGTGTATGLIKGKLGYMAPEQILAEKLDRRVDVFSAGVVLWELLAGRRIGRSSSILEVVRCATDPLPLLCEEVPWVDAELSAIVARAVAVKREERYETAGELREALDEYCVTNSLFAAPSDVAEHLSAVLGADARARDERVRRAYAVAQQMLSNDESPHSSVPTLRAPSPPSDAPMITDTFDPRDARPMSIGRRLTARSVISAAAAAIVVLFAWNQLARPALGASTTRWRDRVVKRVVNARWESLLLGADGNRSSSRTAQGESTHGSASPPQDLEGADGDRRTP